MTHFFSDLVKNIWAFISGTVFVLFLLFYETIYTKGHTYIKALTDISSLFSPFLLNPTS